MDNITTSLLWDIFTLVTNLTNKLESKDLVEFSNGNSSYYIPVNKEKNDEEITGVIEDLKEIISVCNKTKPSKIKNETVFLLIHKSKNAVKYLSKNYPKKTWLGNKNALQNEDRKSLLDGLDEYLDDLGDLLFNNEDIILNLEPKQNIDVEKKLLKTLDISAKADLDEGLSLLHSGHTTASYMILMRVAEFLVQQYFFKKTGRKPKGMEQSMGGMLQTIYDLGYISKVEESYGKLLDFLKDRRNEALHPGKRFNEKDCNKLIKHIEELMEFLYKLK